MLGHVRVEVHTGNSVPVTLKVPFQGRVLLYWGEGRRSLPSCFMLGLKSTLVTVSL